ncbi:unnamed protein product [Owenia fusiformis]|uniref:Uncharacterized protein n=1 Tax=Owenia fusiformis TaxID=6347 RepID=A0A8S4PGD4_OWEFU|nr:unnamed protein product [Owenia fusiformis]
MDAQNSQQATLYNSPVRDRIKEFKGCGAISLGSLLIILGIGAAIIDGMIFHIYYPIELTFPDFDTHYFVGVWTGAFFVLTGIIGIAAGKSKTQCMITTLLVLSVSGIFFAIALLSYSAVTMPGAVQGQFNIYKDSPLNILKSLNPSPRIGLNGALFAIGVICGILCIVSCALGCAVVCCGRRNANTERYYPEMMGQNPQQTAPDNAPVREKINEFKGCGAIFLGSLLMILGIGAAVIGGMIFHFKPLNILSPWLFAGVWSGAVCLVTGFIGIRAGISKTQCMISTYLVLSVLGIFFAIFMIVNHASMVSFYSYSWYYARDRREISVLSLRLGLNGALVAIGVVSGFLCIVSSILGCAVVCCGRRNVRNENPSWNYPGADNSGHIPYRYGREMQQNPHPAQYPQKREQSRF